MFEIIRRLRPSPEQAALAEARLAALSRPTPAASPPAEPAASPSAEPAASPSAEPAASPPAEPAASPPAEPASGPLSGAGGWPDEPDAGGPLSGGWAAGLPASRGGLARPWAAEGLRPGRAEPGLPAWSGPAGDRRRDRPAASAGPDPVGAAPATAAGRDPVGAAPAAAAGSAEGATAGGSGWLPDDGVFDRLGPAGEPGLRVRAPVGPGLAGVDRFAGARRLLGRAPTGGLTARLDPGRRAAAAVVGLGVLAALAVAVLAWRGRPTPVPVTPPPVVAGAAAAGSGSLASRGPTAGGAPAASAPATIVVAVAGRVRRPGVVTLPAGSRVIDAIRAAGGVLPGTNLGLLNLARRLADGELVAVGVPSAGPAGPAGGTVPGSDGTDGSTAGAAGVPVNLNTATAEQLDALPGVGPVLAQRIVEFRAAHGRFDSVEQLRDVSGIGDSKFAQLRSRVTV